MVEWKNEKNNDTSNGLHQYNDSTREVQSRINWAEKGESRKEQSRWTLIFITQARFYHRSNHFCSVLWLQWYLYGLQYYHPFILFAKMISIIKLIIIIIMLLWATRETNYSIISHISPTTVLQQLKHKQVQASTATPLPDKTITMYII